MKTKVIVVEHDHDVLKLLARLLEVNGHTALTAWDTRNGLILINAHTDVKHFVLNAREIEAGEQIRRSSPEARIVFITGGGSPPRTVMAEAVRLGAFVLNKPFKIEGLLEALGLPSKA